MTRSNWPIGRQLRNLSESEPLLLSIPEDHPHLGIATSLILEGDANAQAKDQWLRWRGRASPPSTKPFGRASCR